MDFKLDTMTENSLVALASAGCTVDIKIRSDSDNGVRFDIRIAKGAARHGLAGLEIVADGSGEDGADALRGAVATAETFVHCVRPRPKLPLPEFDLTDARRLSNIDLAEQGNSRARELGDADQGLGR